MPVHDGGRSGALRDPNVRLRWFSEIATNAPHAFLLQWKKRKNFARGPVHHRRRKKEVPVDKDTHVSLHRSKVGRPDMMLKSGRFEDLYREFKAVPSSTRSEYFMMEADRKIGLQEIENVAKRLGIFGQQ